MIAFSIELSLYGLESLWHDTITRIKLLQRQIQEKLTKWGGKNYRTELELMKSNTSQT